MVGCAHQEYSILWSTETEPNYGASFAITNPMDQEDSRVEIIGGLGVNYVEETNWGRSRTVFIPRSGIRYQQEKWYTEVGISPWIVPNWSSGTTGEIVIYWRSGIRVLPESEHLWAFFEFNHNYSNAADDPEHHYGEHPREPGAGILFGLTLRY